jgi:hypothetical protein
MLNFVRRVKYSLAKAGVTAAVGGVDFSFNEDKEGRYSAFWSPHCYIVTLIKNRDQLARDLKRLFRRDFRIPRPVQVPRFRNSRLRRSYAFKIFFQRRIGCVKMTRDNRRCRDTFTNRLRAIEKIELFTYLDEIGFASRFVLWGLKPVTRAGGVVLAFT